MNKIQTKLTSRIIVLAKNLSQKKLLFIGLALIVCGSCELDNTSLQHGNLDKMTLQIDSNSHLNEGSNNDGKELFLRNCSACHSLQDKKIVGPGLAGLVEKRGCEWLIEFTQDSQEMIKTDPIAKAIYEEYYEIPMPSYHHLTSNDIRSIYHYIETANGNQFSWDCEGD